MDGIALIILGISCIFLTITLIGRLLNVLMVGHAKDIFHVAIGRGPLAGILARTFIILVQSSPTTPSLMVPLAWTIVNYLLDPRQKNITSGQTGE